MEQLSLFDQVVEPVRSCPAQIWTDEGLPLFHVYGSGVEAPQYAPNAQLAALLPELPPDLLAAGYRRDAHNQRWIVAPDGVVFAWTSFNDNLACARRWFEREALQLDQPKRQKEAA